MDDAVNGFNQYFVNVGPVLAEKIPVPVRSDDRINDFIDINPKSMFLTAVEESEIIEIVNKCKNKTSTDYSDIDMRIVKEVIHGI